MQVSSLQMKDIKKQLNFFWMIDNSNVDKPLYFFDYDITTINAV